MERWRSCLVVSCVLFVGCGAATPELQLIEDAAEAMGSLRAVSNSTGMTVEGQGRTYRLGQNSRPSAELDYYEIENYQLQLDFANQRWQVRQDRTSTFVTGNPLYGVRQTYGLDGEVAYDQQGDQAVRASDRVAVDRWVEMYHNPLGIVLLALDETSTVSNLREEGGQQVVDVVAANGTQLTLFVDGETTLPTRVMSSTYHSMLGDIVFETTFEDYAETGGLGGFQARLTMPRTYTTNLGEFMISQYRVTTDPHAELGDLSAPAAEAISTDVSVETEEITDGVWHLTGGSHHSVVVEFDEFLALVEAPQSEARTLAVIAQARELQPDKPLQYVVNTHHHFDHSAGIRAAVSEGLTVVTHQVNRSFYEDLVARQHTIEQDALARNPQPLTMETVAGDDVFELTSGRRTLEISRIVGDPHSESNLMAYLPRERLVIEADAFSPRPDAPAPFAASLLDTIEAQELRVNSIIPIHGGVATLEDLESAVGNR